MDFTPLNFPGTFVFDGTTQQTLLVMVDIIDDVVVEETELLLLRLSSADPAVVLGNTQLTLEITDDDGKNTM